MAQLTFRLPASGSCFRSSRASQGTLGALRPPGPSDASGGAGWHESSRELRQGLDVVEGLPADPQLHEWIEVCLRE
jgi:hypothetical protein